MAKTKVKAPFAAQPFGVHLKPRPEGMPTLQDPKDLGLPGIHPPGAKSSPFGATEVAEPFYDPKRGRGRGLEPDPKPAPEPKPKEPKSAKPPKPQPDPVPAPEPTPKKKPAAAQPVEEKPKMIVHPHVDPNSITWDGEEPWLAEMLNKAWGTLPADWDRNELAQFPHDALKAILFYLAQGKSGVNFKDQYLPGEIVALQIVDDARKRRADEDAYNQKVKQYYADKASQDAAQLKYERKQAMAQPLPTRPIPRFV